MCITNLETMLPCSRVNILNSRKAFDSVSSVHVDLVGSHQ